MLYPVNKVLIVIIFIIIIIIIIIISYHTTQEDCSLGDKPLISERQPLLE